MTTAAKLAPRRMFLRDPDPASREILLQTPWCAGFYADPTLQAMEVYDEDSRVRGSNSSSSGNSKNHGGNLFGRTLRSADTLAATQYFYQAPEAERAEPPSASFPTTTTSPASPGAGRIVKSTTGPPATHAQVVTLYELGPGLDGHPDICHGGFVAVLLDEVIGTAAGLHRPVEKTTMTAYLNTTYHAPVRTPGPVVCRAWCDRVEGQRKIFCTGVLEDGEGRLLATGEGLFVIVERIRSEKGKL